MLHPKHSLRVSRAVSPSPAPAPPTSNIAHTHTRTVYWIGSLNVRGDIDFVQLKKGNVIITTDPVIYAPVDCRVCVWVVGEIKRFVCATAIHKSFSLATFATCNMNGKRFVKHIHDLLHIIFRIRTGDGRKFQRNPQK